jgi:DNA-binding MarR family transcriptional regulator
MSGKLTIFAREISKIFMTDYINTGFYLKALSDDLVGNLHLQLEQQGYGEIRPSHGMVFQYMQEEGSRITDLAAKVKITKQSMSTLVYQLEDWGYLERKPDPTDKRAVLFVFTAKGWAVRKLGRSINYEFEQKWEQKLGMKNFSLFRQLLQRLWE